MDETGPNKKWCIFILIWQVLMIIFYSGSTKYSTSSATYSTFQDVHVMIFIGFGFLMTYLKKYCFSSVSFNFAISCFAIEWAILIGGFWARVDDVSWKDKIELSVESLIDADFAAAAVLITFGALLGKVNLLQLTFIAFMEIIFYYFNIFLLGCGKGICVADIGGSLVIHAFGAYFGLAASYMLGGKDAVASADCSSNKTSDLFSMIGTIFLWMFWPSFNSALAGDGLEANRVIVNTVLSISASCLTSFMVSAFLNAESGYKFQMVHVQNATLAGGVAIGTTANMMIYPAGALFVGSCAGILSVLGFEKVNSFLEEKFSLHDTCGVHNLHGMPAVFAGVVSIFVAAAANSKDYDGTLLAVFPDRDDRNSSEQALAQFGGLIITLLIAILSGCLTGFLAKREIFSPPTTIFDDKEFWDYEHGFEHGHHFEARPENLARVGSVKNIDAS